MADEAVIIAGALDAKELENSIDQLVNFVGNKTTEMAGKFEKSMDIMKSAMKDFAVTQKVSVDLMKQAWKEMGASFDAMVQAESAAKGGGGKGKGKTVYPDNTIGALEQEIKLEKERRKEMELGTDVLRTQNNLIMERTNRLKAEKRGQMSLKDVLGMDESSIDAVRLKLNALKTVKVDPKNAEDVKRLGDAYANLSILQTQMMGKNAQLVDSNQALARSFNYIRNRMVYMLTVGTLGSFVKEIYEVRGQYELLERSLGVLVNSFEQGKQIFQELNQMSLESPFTLMELAGAAKQLTAYNFSAKEVVDTTRRLADISAALGVPMERLTYNLGQIRAQTVLTARDARDFANAGLPIVKSLSDYYTELEGKVVSTGEVYSRMSKKMVSYSDVMAVLNKMTDEGGKFFEFQAKQAQTLRVQIANLQLAYNNMLNEIGEENQWFISLPLRGLKLLLQNWGTLGRILKNVVLTFGLLRVAQMIAIRNNLAWAASATTAARQMDILKLGIQKLGASLKALAANPWAGAFAVIFALSDLIGQYRRNVEEVAKLNEEMRKGAEEASQSNLDFLSNKGNQATLKLAQEGKLTAEQGEKAWTGIKEQIENSAAASDKFIGELLTIEDVNERVSKGFDYVASIQKAQAALRDLKDDVIKISQDLGWGGMFGEGLASDLKDYGDFLEKYSNYFKAQAEFGDFKTSYKTALDLENFSGIILSNPQEEFLEELEETAQSIKNFIDVQNITDPLQINEILERARAVIKLKNPEIKGDLAALFDVSLDQRMSELTNGAVDANASLWAMFMERLKHNSSAAFQDITNDIYKKNATLTKEQQEAVDKNLEYFKNAMPWYYDAVKKMVDDASKLRINIGIAFDVQQLTDFQEEVNKRILAKFGTMGKDQFNAMLPTQNDNLASWAKTQQDAIAKLKDENEKYSKDNTAWSKEQIKNNEEEIRLRKNLLDLFKQSYVKEKKGSGSSKDPLGDAVKKNIQYVNEIRKKYEEYRKEGLNTNEALEEATKHYSKSLARVNQELSKYGIQGLTGEQLATMNLQQVRDYFQGMLNGAGASAKAVEALEKAIGSVDDEIIKFRQKAIIEGLNSELGKLKDEYELAVELDANPELGNMFTEMFGIDTTNFPKTIDEYMKRAQQAFDDARTELNYASPLDIFKASEGDWKKWANEVGLSEDALKSFNGKFIEAQGVAKKWAQDIVKQTKDLQYKLADTNGKIAIEEEKLATIQENLAKETNETQIALLKLQEKDQINTIDKLKESILEMLPTYQRAFGEVAEHSASMARKLIRNYKDMLIEAQKAGKNENGKYEITDPISGEKVEITESKLGKEIKNADKALQKSEPIVNKIKEAFTKGKDKVVDWAKGVELIGDEFGKLGSLVGVVGEIASAFSNPNEYSETAEVIGDISTSISGVGEAAKGIAQIKNGDIIGGATSVVKGLWTSISTWFDNSDKKILQQIKDSERAVKDLELAYKSLEHTAEDFYGSTVIGAKEALKANRQLQLEEVKRQLRLEQSRSSKKRDEDRIRDLRGQIMDLQHEISKATMEIINDLLGISSHEDFFQSLISDMRKAFQEGEDMMKVFDEKWGEMIDSMVDKQILGQILSQWVKNLEKGAESIVEQYTMESSQKKNELTQRKLDMQAKDAGDLSEDLYDNNRDYFNELLRRLGQEEVGDMSRRERYEYFQKNWDSGLAQKIAQLYYADLDAQIAQLDEEIANQSIDATDALIDYYTMKGEEFKEKYGETLFNWMQEHVKQNADEAQTSALQAGIQSITETTAGALEAITTGMYQQVTQQTTILTQIQTTIDGFDLDAQLGVQSQMLLQLQSSYQTQRAIQSILEGWSSANGMAVKVEMV